MAQQPGLGDFTDRLQELSADGDPLEKLSATLDFGTTLLFGTPKGYQ